MNNILKDCPTLSDYIARYQVDGVLWKAEKLLANIPENDIMEKNNRAAEIAGTIAKIPASQQVRKDEYIQRISKTYGINKKTLEKLIADQTDIEGKKTKLTRSIRKNTPVTLNENPKTFPFFVEIIDIKNDDFKGIKIDLVKYVQLLGSFGFTRYATDSDTKDGYTFVRLLENVIKEVSKEEIKDFMENFIRTEYDFDGSGCDHVDADKLINVFYENIKKYFSKDLFARVRNTNPIIMNRDTATECFLYYKNGFVRITKDTCELTTYDRMEGSVWQKQMLTRNFKKIDLQMTTKEEDGKTVPDLDASFTTDLPMGVYADFVWRICGQKQQRFASLCSILGYLVHDYYDYKLKGILLTDSTISDSSEGRTGKTLAMQILGFCRSYCEINGKQFHSEDERKYQLADRSTQILHLNDLAHKGKFKFDIESVFNDITEGYMVRNMFKSPFRQRSKIVFSSNKAVKIDGASARDRVVEFEMSSFFSEKRFPKDYYGGWMGKDWNDDEFNRFDNFICFCVQVFFQQGLIAPDTINLDARKLLQETSPEFLEFMGDLADAIKTTGEPWTDYNDRKLGFERVTKFEDFEFDKKKLYDKFLLLYPDFKSNHFTQRRFTDCLKLYAKLQIKVEPIERRGHGISYIQFKASGTK